MPTITQAAVRGMTTHRTPQFIAAYIYLQQHDYQETINSLPFVLTDSERATLLKIKQKKRAAMREAQAKQLEETYAKARRNYFLLAKQTKVVQRFRSYFTLVDHFEEYFNSLNSDDARDLAELRGRASWQLSIGQRLKSYAKDYPPYQLPVKEKKPLWEEYDLYSCSGELEADEMHSARICKIARDKNSWRGNHAIWRHSDHLNFSRDGGGQAETQFHIRPELARVVCKLVKQIGRISKNGGHIHLNCKMDNVIGNRVYDAMRYHLSWSRWLVPFARRDHHWSAVNKVRNTFMEAMSQKDCALSCNTWRRTGTVEMRLWGTTNKAEEWLGRAALMRAMAQWSEHFNATGTGIKPISNETALEAWPMFFNWASRNAPEGLCYALKTFRKKLRSSATPILDKRAAETFMRQWEDSRLTCRGYRCRNRVTAPLVSVQEVA
jgi:hypothetical protein